MTVHAPSDVRAITVPAERGGCGTSHEAGELADGDRFSIDCPACEAVIAAMRTGWAQQPHAVALTPDEIGVAQAAESQAARARNRTWGDASELAKAFASAIQGGMSTPSAAPSLLEQVAAMSVQERAAFAAMLTASLPTPTGEPETVAEPVRRGRSRKANPTA